MPIVAHTQLPTFEVLRTAGEGVLTRSEALSQDIREMHIGLLNMMPDAALRVTEQQFMRLIGGANQIVQVYVHVFTVAGLPRSTEAQGYIDRFYTPFAELASKGLDALVVTGANVGEQRLQDEAFWSPLAEIMEWAGQHVTSTLCSCLASHAILQHTYGIHRRRLQAKRWGVFAHRNTAHGHPLLRGINSRYDVPHSRWNAVTPEQMRQAGLRVLAETDDGDLHLGASTDGFRTIFLQGHPEYDTVSLLKEYKREVDRHLAGEIPVPPLPQNYFSPVSARKAMEHIERAVTARDPAATPFPEEELLPDLDNTWTDTGKAVFNNWLGLVYRLTGYDRGVQFMDDVDPADPLGLGG